MSRAPLRAEEVTDPWAEDGKAWDAGRHPNFPDTRDRARDLPTGLLKLLFVCLLLGWLAYLFGIVGLIATARDPGPLVRAVAGADGLVPSLTGITTIIVGFVLKRQQDRTEALAGNKGAAVLRAQNHALRDQLDALADRLDIVAGEVLSSRAENAGLSVVVRGAITELGRAGAPARGTRRQDTAAVPAVPPPAEPVPAEEQLQMYVTAVPPEPGAIALSPEVLRAAELTWDDILAAERAPGEEPPDRPRFSRLPD